MDIRGKLIPLPNRGSCENCEWISHNERDERGLEIALCLHPERVDNPDLHKVFYGSTQDLKCHFHKLGNQFAECGYKIEEEKA